MGSVEWNKPIFCKRYKSQIDIRTCIIRFKIGSIAGCASCSDGLKLFEKYGSQFEELTTPSIIKKLQKKFKGLLLHH